MDDRLRLKVLKLESLLRLQGALEVQEAMTAVTEKVVFPRKPVYTTGEVARVCGVSTQAVIKWFDQGMLSGYRIPRSKERRIPHHSLIRFMQEHALPLDTLEGSTDTRRILIVDDNPSIGSLIQDVLGELSDVELRVVTSGFEAGAEVVNFRPHLIVLDIMLPDLDGRHVARYIRANPQTRKVKIIAVTVLSDEVSRTDIMAAGFDGYVTKPFSIEELRRTVAEHLGRDGKGKERAS